MKYSVILWSSFALAASACTMSAQHNDEGGRCTSNSDCQADLVCSNNVCKVPLGTEAAGGATDGTTAGTATGGATAGTTTVGTSAGKGGDGGIDSGSDSGSNGGTDSGTNSGTSAGANGGLGSSAGSTSAGTSSGGGSSGGSASHSQLRLINAALGSGAIDVCVKAVSAHSFGASGIVGGAGVAAGGASAFVPIPQAPVTVHVVLASAGCGTAVGGVADTTFDATDASEVYSAVALSLGAATVGGVTVATNTPSATAVNVSVVNGSNVAMIYADALPYKALPGTIAPGAASSADFASFTGTTVQVGAHDFNNVAPPAGAAQVVETVVALGETSILVCSGGLGASSSCLTAIGVAPQAYVRVANVADAGAVYLCAHKVGGNYPAATLGTTVMRGVSAFAPIDAQLADFKVRAVSGTSSCTGQGLALLSSYPLAARSYYTFGLSGTVNTYKLSGAATLPASPSSALALTLFNGLADSQGTANGFGSAALTSSAFASALATLGAIGTSVTAAPAPASYASLDGASLVAAGTNDTVSYNHVALPETDSTALSLFFGGDIRHTPYLLVCADDGSADGVASVCAETDGVLSSAPVAPH